MDLDELDSFFATDDDGDDNASQAPSFSSSTTSSSSDEPLTPLRIQFLDDSIYGVLMASSDVDQKFLGKFAQQTAHYDPLLSDVLYKILGLSVLLSKKLFRARRLRRLDVTRDTKSLQLYHHIIWLSREGLVLLEEYVLPRVTQYSELKVLAFKLRGSFYHIFVLFHNQPSINRAAAIPSAQQARASTAATATRRNNDGRNASIRRTPPHLVEDADDDDPYEQTAARTQALPPGLAPISIPKPAASFLLPATDYIPNASACFERAMNLAGGLSGSHPLRLSVAVEYCAYRYDCLHDGDGSRRLARTTIRAVYNATDSMSDETFADSANLVGVLGKMMKRGLATSSTGGASSAARTDKSHTPDRREASPTATKHASSKHASPPSSRQRSGRQSPPQPSHRTRTNSDSPRTHKHLHHTNSDSPKGHRQHHHTNSDSPKSHRQQNHSSPDSPKSHRQHNHSNSDSPKSQRQRSTSGGHTSNDVSPAAKTASKTGNAKFVRTNKLTTPWEPPPSPDVRRKTKPVPVNTKKELPPTPGSQRRQSRSTSSGLEGSRSPTRHRRKR